MMGIMLRVCEQRWKPLNMDYIGKWAEINFSSNDDVEV